MFTKWTLLAKGATCFCYTVSVMNNGLFIERIFELLSAVCFRCYFIQVNSLREKYGGGGMFLKKLWCCVGGVRGEGGVGIPR